MRGISKLAVTAATAVALTSGGLTAANLASAAPGDKTEFCKTTEHYAYHRNSTGQWVRCLPHTGSNGKTQVGLDRCPPAVEGQADPPEMAPPAVATTKRPHFSCGPASLSTLLSTTTPNADRGG